MATVYASLDDVKTVLNNLIRFSDAIYQLGPHNSNTGTINIASSGIVLNDKYSGFHKRWEFRFLDALDATHYYIYEQVSTETNINMVYKTDGYTGINKTITDIMIINAAGWSGAADITGLPGHFDLIVLETDSHISVEKAYKIGNDIEYAIDEVLREKSLLMTAESGTAPALTGTIPRLIQVALKYLWAFQLVDNTFRASRHFNSMNGKSDPNDNQIAIGYGWLKNGTKALAQYIKSRNIANGNAPRWINTAPLITKIGITNVGTVGTTVDEDYTESTNDMPNLLEYYLDTSGSIELEEE